MRASSWDTIQIGDRANLHGSDSVFAVDTLTAEIERRCIDHDIHPTATLWGKGAPLSCHQVAEVENALAQVYSNLAQGLIRAGVDAASRPLRVVPADLEISLAPDTLGLSFYLPRGSYATALLREIAAL